MTNWKTYRLGDICTLNYGKSLTATNRVAGDIPAYSSAGITGSHNVALVQNKGIIVGRKDTVGTVYYSDKPFYCIDTAYYILPDDEKYDFKWLYYRLKSLHLDKLNEDSAVPGLNRETAYAQEFPLPPLEEQRRIAGILGAIDDKIENNRRINTNLELQAQALYKQWFADFEFPNEEDKPYKSSGGKMVDSELGPIPEGWCLGKLEDIGDIIGGGTPSKAVAEYYTKNGIAWITPKDLSVSHSKFTSKGETDITELGYKNSSAKIMPRGSVLFSSRAPIGYISIAKNDICTNQGFKSVVPNNGCTAFVYYFLLSNTENIESKATGSIFKEASGALMKSLDLVIPSEDILENFENIMSPIFELQEKFEAENETLATLRDTLLPKLMSGEIITK